jgi:hypothetical protein
MQASNANFTLGEALRKNFSVVPDPGTGNVINLGGKQFAIGKGWGAGTYILPNIAEGAGCVFYAIADGAQIFTNVAGTTIGTLASGEAAQFISTTTSGWSGVLLSASAAVEINTAADLPIDDPASDFGQALTAAGIANNAAALFEAIYSSTLGTTGCVDIPLSSFREVDADGDVGNLAAVGGTLASDSTPFLEGGGTTNAWRIAWATGNVDRIASSVCLPSDFNGAANVTVQFIVASAGTTNSFNAAVLVTNWDGGADVVDALTDTATTTVKVAPGTVAAADVPNAALTVTVSLTPPTHATDILYMYGCRILYTKIVDLVIT